MDRRRRTEKSMVQETRQAWEPSLAEMLADPVVRAVMKVDRVSSTDIVTLMSEAQARVSGHPLQ